MKPLEDMDLLDDFLNNCAASSSYNTEIYRIILETLLDKPLGNIRIDSQRPVSSANPNLRGIRLDVSIKESDDTGTVTTVYDYEPHRAFSDDMFKAVRYRQATLDSQGVPTGTKDFHQLPDLYILYILDSDPFGEDQLVYTVQKQVKEAPNYSYEDGFNLFYFNTKGHFGGSQSVRNMLSYIGNSHDSNVTDDATKQLDQYISTIKASSDVKDEYMTWDEILKEEMKERDAIIAEKDAEIAEKDAEIAEKDSTIAEKDSTIAEKDAEIAEKDSTIAVKDSEIAALKKQLAALTT